MAGGLTSICSPQSILCRIFFPKEEKAFFRKTGRERFLPEKQAENDFSRKNRQKTISLQNRKNTGFLQRKKKTIFSKERERYFSRNGEEDNTQIEKGIGGR
jgi:hypothetical protein